MARDPRNSLALAGGKASVTILCWEASVAESRSLNGILTNLGGERRCLMRQLFSPGWTRGVLWGLMPLLLVLGACSRSSLPGPTGTVTGTVTYQGEPVPAGCCVVFIHEETSAPASGLISSDGSYTLTMLGQKKILAGRYKVSVSPRTSNAQIDGNAEKHEVTMTGEWLPQPGPYRFPTSIFWRKRAA